MLRYASVFNVFDRIAHNFKECTGARKWVTSSHTEKDDRNMIISAINILKEHGHRLRDEQTSGLVVLTSTITAGMTYKVYARKYLTFRFEVS